MRFIQTFAGHLPIRLLFLVVCGLFSLNVFSAGEVGSVVFAKGAISAQDATGAPRLLARNSPIYQNDTIVTARKSFAVIKFVDDTKMSIRPNSEITIDRFNASPGEETAEFSIVKGGLRALTGAIGNRKPENVRFRTREASIGIRGTDLAIRICEDDECWIEELALSNFEPVKTNCLTRMDKLPPGEFIVVFSGAIVTGNDAGKEIEMEAIAAAYASEEELTCLAYVPRFLVHDEFLNQVHKTGFYLELDEILGTSGDVDAACEIL